MTQAKCARKAALLLSLSTGIVFGSATAAAQAPAPSSNAMINLVRLLVAQGTISKAKGDELIAEATKEAEAAHAAEQAAAAPRATPAAPQVATLPPAPNGTIRVPYIPETVRKSIRDDIRNDVMREAKAEGWASPGQAAPEWTKRIAVGGDLRLRSQSQFYSRFNSTSIPNFQSIVNNGPLDLLSGNIPFLNTTVNKYDLISMRARINLDAKITDRINVGFQLATGNDGNPVSEKVSSSGDFFKRNFYLTKAFVAARPTDWSSVTAGRFGNPFVSSDAIFAPDLNFDGLLGEVTLRDRAFGYADFKVRGGAFPLDFGTQNFPETASAKQSQPQKWLLAGQVETDWRLAHNVRLDLAAAYYYYANVNGRLSAPCPLGYNSVTQCSTDGFAPYFVQNGNSLFQMRNIVNASGVAVDGSQLLGLVQKFQVLDVIGTLHVPVSAQTEFSLMGDYLTNLAFRRSRACRYGQAGEPVNNGGVGGSGNICDTTAANATPYVAGRRGFQIMTGLGYANPNARGQWRVFAGYKYLESDSTLDAFNDPDFHLGGTNAKGFILGGTVGLARNVRAGVRWLSANQVSGDPFAVDVLQVDLNVGF